MYIPTTPPERDSPDREMKLWEIYQDNLAAELKQGRMWTYLPLPPPPPPPALLPLPYHRWYRRWHPELHMLNVHQPQKNEKLLNYYKYCMTMKMVVDAVLVKLEKESLLKTIKKKPHRHYTSSSNRKIRFKRPAHASHVDLKKMNGRDGGTKGVEVRPLGGLVVRV